MGAVIVPARFQAQARVASWPTATRAPRLLGAVLVVGLAVVGLAVVGLAVGAKVAGAGGGAPASTPVGTGVQAVYIVQPGDTLWSIAAAQRPSVETSGLVRQLVSLNGGTTLQVGQRLILP